MFNIMKNSDLFLKKMHKKVVLTANKKINLSSMRKKITAQSEKIVDLEFSDHVSMLFSHSPSLSSLLPCLTTTVDLFWGASLEN